MRWALAWALLAACDAVPDDVSDGEPFGVDVADGALRVTLRDDDGAELPAVIDLMSPITVRDVGPAEIPDRRTRAFWLLGRAPGATAAAPRARLEATVFEFHPCQGDACVLGRVGSTAPVSAVVGADAVDGDTPRLDVAAGTLALLPDVAGDESDRGRACDAVFPGPLRGGGNLEFGGTTVPFPGRRITLAACLAPDPDPGLPPSARGTSVVLVQSTATGPTLLAAAAYERYRIGQGNAPPALEGLPETTAYLPSGPIAGRLATISRLALAGDSTRPRGGCGEVYASHYLAAAACDPVEDPSCPCEADSTCTTAGIVELTPAAGLTVVVVPDDDATLQALRAEIRPSDAEVDGILGTDALRGAILDVDYPRNRLLWRCADPATCAVRPQLRSGSGRPDLAACLGAAL